MNSTEKTLSDIHLSVEKAMGELSIALERRAVKPGALNHWVGVLENAGRRLRELAKELDRGV
jgi:hypothetical protein